MKEQVHWNKDASKKFLFKKMVLKFCFKFFLQDIAVKEQCLNFSNDSMLFLINFRDSTEIKDRREIAPIPFFFLDF